MIILNPELPEAVVHTLIPRRDLTVGDIVTLKTACFNILNYSWNNYMPVGNGAIIRDLSPRDFGLSDWAIPRGKGLIPWINTIMLASNAIIFNRVLQLSANPTASRIRFSNQGVILGDFDLESCYAGLPILQAMGQSLVDPVAREVLDRIMGREDMAIAPSLGSPMEGFINPPVFCDFGGNIKVDIEAKSTSDNYLVLGGYIIEPRGKTIV